VSFVVQLVRCTTFHADDDEERFGRMSEKEIRVKDRKPVADARQ
jgi:hypothetical protein